MEHDRSGDFQCLSPLPDSRVHVRFAGPFAGRQVQWDMRLYTLQRYGSEVDAQTTGAGQGLRAFIDIQAGAGDCYRLTVGLNVPVIDEPTVRKTVVMIRNYRRLRLGRHEWGEPVMVDRQSGSGSP